MSIEGKILIITAAGATFLAGCRPYFPTPPPDPTMEELGRGIALTVTAAARIPTETPFPGEQATFEAVNTAMFGTAAANATEAAAEVWGDCDATIIFKYATSIPAGSSAIAVTKLDSFTVAVSKDASTAEVIGTGLVRKGTLKDGDQRAPKGKGGKVCFDLSQLRGDLTIHSVEPFQQVIKTTQPPK